ncbi:MAG: hypothetical protein PHE50_05520 [Dehalococcoidales bacterium]|nr:hypothetical protein [Dehalococcoidales bacterium]
MQMKQAILRDFNADTYVATIELSGSGRAYLEGITVARNIGNDEMINGRKLSVVFFDEHNAKEAVVVAVYV